MKRWVRSLHKWVGLILALQFVLWMASGLVMSLLDPETLEGRQHRAEAGQLPKAWPAGMQAPAQVLAAAGRPVEGLEATWLRALPVYRLHSESGTWLVAAADGRPVSVDATVAAAIAAEDYAGAGIPDSPEWLRVASAEVRGHEGAIWRISFRDAEDTTLYVSARDGQILERRNRTWRLFDVFWMLHIMDYSGRQDFNSPLVIMAASGGLWIALSGIWLLFTSFRLAEFKLVSKRSAP